VETVQPLLLDHQSVEWLIGHVGTLEEFGLVESMQVPDILHFAPFLSASVILSCTVLAKTLV
jgi:hypothetical protein